MDKILVIKAIIKEQSLIIGERLAINRAIASGVVKFNTEDIEDIYLITDDPTALDRVIHSFEEVFGLASTEVCKNVIKRMQVVH